MLHVSLEPAWQDRHLDIVSPTEAARGPSPIPLPPAQLGNTYTGNGSNNVKHGTSGDDVFNMYQGGHDTVYCGGGNDEIHFGRFFESGDAVHGGDGFDTLFLSGNAYAAGFTIAGSMIASVENITLASGANYKIAIADAVVAPGQPMVVTGDAVDAVHSLNFDGSAETNGVGLLLYGGSGNDTLIMGATGGQVQGNGGVDTLVGGSGAETFSYVHPSESTDANFDTIDRFNCHDDSIYAAGLDGFDGKVAHGALSRTVMDHDLEAAIRPHKLDANHAVLFTPASGTLAGKVFLVLDENGHAGFQAGEDYVIELDHASHLADMNAANFLG